MAEIPARGPATSWLVATLTEALSESELGVGDGIAPEGFGWPKGQPGVGTFKPYLVVKTLQASPQRGQQPLGTAQADAWTFPYLLTGWGELREQADFVCDTANAVLGAVDVRQFRGDGSFVPGFDLQQIPVAPLGTTDRDDKTSPQTWSRSDTCVLWLARAQPRRRG